MALRNPCIARYAVIGENRTHQYTIQDSVYHVLQKGHAMTRTRLLVSIAVVLVAGGHTMAARNTPLIIDHTCTDITRIPEWAIMQAKGTLHIAYGHTSHGSQVTSGMTALVAFANAGGKGLSLPENIFAWNHGGENGALDLHSRAMGRDVGYYPEWMEATTEYLNSPQNVLVNVVMWAWCAQAHVKYAEDKLFEEYIYPMGQLELQYPRVTFVYMTDIVYHKKDANVKAANQIIRDYCEAYNKVLYDFADIESHDPDGKYFAFPSDNCDYYASLTGPLLGNWAREWQESHVLGVDWYNCASPHSEPLNANQKAYAAWWLFARLAGWSGDVQQIGFADVDGDGRVDFHDLARLGQNWLEDQG